MTAPHMTPDEFRRAGHEVIDWIASYWERLDELAVLSTVEPGEIRRRLPPAPPERGEPLEGVLEDMERVVVPGLTHWQAPGFFAYFPANASGPSILGDLLSSGLGVQGMLWATSPAATEMEAHVLDWLVGMLGLPEAFLSSTSGGGVIQDSASSATLAALLCARERATEGAANRRGVRDPLVVYTSVHGHSSIEKGARVAGFGSDHVRAVAADPEHRMVAAELEAAILRDLADGLAPAAVVATVGTTSSASVDPVPEIGRICRRHGLWLHVDGAYAGTAAVLPEMRWINEGLDLADSYVFNPHKWMLTNFDCSAFFVRDRRALIDTLSILPEYLRNQATESGAVVDYRDWQVPLGRRFRALKLWLVLRHYGVEGIRAHVREGMALAARFAAWVTEHPDFEVAAPVHFGLVCFRHRGGDDANSRIMDSVNAGGRSYLTHTRLDGLLTLRMAVGASSTRLEHVERFWEDVQEAAAGAAIRRHRGGP